MLRNLNLRVQCPALVLCGVLLCAAAVRGDEPSVSAQPPLSAEVLAERAQKSLVVVRATDRTGSDSGLGTGFVIEGGLIATAHHVIGDGREIRVELPDGKLVPVVEVYASSSRLDLAILKVADLQLPALTLSADDRTPQGREVVALGHPEGFRNSIVSGVISGHQDIDGVEMLQLAMSIERGNSGGPVLDRQGSVVGIVTRKSALQDKLGFAVPVRLLRELKSDPNPVLMSRWSTIGALDPQQWTVVSGGNWRQRAGRILVRAPAARRASRRPAPLSGAGHRHRVPGGEADGERDITRCFGRHYAFSSSAGGAGLGVSTTGFAAAAFCASSFCRAAARTPCVSASPGSSRSARRSRRCSSASSSQRRAASS